MNTPDKKPEDIHILLPIITTVLFLAVVTFIFLIFESKQTKYTGPEAVVHTSTHVFDRVDIQAQSVVVWDVTQQRVLFARDAYTPRPLASLTKVMTAVTAVTLLPRDTVITISKEFLAEEGDSGLYSDERWHLKDLIDYSLLVSSNDGMRAVASVAGATGLGQTSGDTNYAVGLQHFIDVMNQTAQGLGLKTLHFTNETGLGEAPETAGGYGSAMDTTKLMEYVLKKYPALMEATKDRTETLYSNNKRHTAQNTDEALAGIPNIVASKTGFTDLSGGNLVVAFDAGVGRPIIITVLGSTYDGRFVDMQKLASSTLAYIRAE